MKSPGSIGIMIIIISFFGVAFISAINVESTYNEHIDYEFKADDLFKTKNVKLSEYQNYIIPENKDDSKGPQHITLYHQNEGKRSFSAVSLSNSEITPLKTILDSLNYSENCESITVNFNLNIDEWDEHGIKYPLTPLLCVQNTPHHLLPVGLNGYNDYLTNIIFEYVPGDKIITLKNYDDDGKYIDSTYLQIDTLFIGHHYSKLTYQTIKERHTLKIDKSDYIIKWCEKQISINNTISNPIIDIKETYPNIPYCKVNLSNFTKYGGDGITINGTSFQIFENQIITNSELYYFDHMDIIFGDKCLLKINDDKTEDLGKTTDYKISLSGDWAFESKFYEGHYNKEITGYKWNMNPYDIFEINSSTIVAFIGAVILLSAICTYSIGLNFIDWAVIIFVIVFILMIW